MSAVVTPFQAAGVELPLLVGDGARRLAFDGARVVDVAQFLADVRAAAAALPEARYAINLCEDRYRFLVAFCAVALRGQTNLLPHSRAPDVVLEELARYPDSYCVAEAEPLSAPVPPRFHRLTYVPLPAGAFEVPRLPADQVVAIGFTSGSTGQPKANPKTWGAFCASTADNLALVRGLLGDAADASIAATVPPQHMYGMEMSVLLPLLGHCAVHMARPFFPAEVAQALADGTAPRLLVTTPVHLRTLIASGTALPPLAGILSSTAPLPEDLAQQAERHYGTSVREVFGSTETCVIAHRRTAFDAAWTLQAGVELHPQPDGTQVQAPWLAHPVTLQDIVELQPERRFRLCGRNGDLLEIAGKRASLGELTRRLLALPGVRDGVVLQSDEAGAGGVRRIVALAVAPERSAGELLAALRASVDPVFLPRPLLCVDALPRNETGKLPRAALLELLKPSTARVNTR